MFDGFCYTILLHSAQHPARASKPSYVKGFQLDSGGREKTGRFRDVRRCVATGDRTRVTGISLLRPLDHRITIKPARATELRTCFRVPVTLSSVACVLYSQFSLPSPIVPLHIVIITSSNQFGAKRNGCSWWEFDWRRWERTPFEFSEQCLSKFLALVLYDMSCRMPKDCWGNRFLEEDGNCELFFCRRSNRPLVWGTWH